MLQATCPGCGSVQQFDASLAGRVATCPACGAAVSLPAAGAQASNTHVVPQNSGLALAALITGIVGVFIFPLELVAIVLGVLALRQIRASNGTLGGRGMALAGLIVGAVVTVLQLVVVALFLALFVATTKSHSGSGTPGTYRGIDVFYYDTSLTSGTDMDRLFPASSGEFPPIEAPSEARTPDGQFTGVRAWVFGCGNCSDKSKWFIGFLETYTKEAKDGLIEISKPLPPGASPPMPTAAEMMARENGHLISIPSEGKWVPYSGPAGLELIQRAQSRCVNDPGGRAVPCYPRS